MTQENTLNNVLLKTVDLKQLDGPERTASSYSEEKQEESSSHRRISKYADSQSKFSYHSHTYQAEVVEQPAEEGEATTTGKPTEMPETVPTEETTQAVTEASTSAPAQDQPTQDQAAPQDQATSPQPTKTEDTSVAAASKGETSQPEAGTPVKTDAGKSPTTEASPSATTTEEKSTDVKPTEEPKDPYEIEIPLQKKINKRTQRKLWEEIEKRKPLIPRHVADHIKKYAKPPFETWGCKYKGRGSCFGCR